MRIIQRIVTSVLPRKWAASLEAESREWIIACPCGYSNSIWEMGGIRWKAKGNRTFLMMCRQCRERTSHTLSRRPSDEVV